MSGRLAHATGVVVQGVGVLLTGRSGAGKSDLALRLIDRGAVLVGDDYLWLRAEGDRLVAEAPPTIAGKLEVRGVGIVELDHVERAPVGLVVTLEQRPPRFPEPATTNLCDIDVPTLAIDPDDSSAPIKVELAVRRLCGRPAVRNVS